MSRRESTAVMARKKAGADRLNMFPTPPWAARALPLEILFPLGLAERGMTCWEPACGAGHMAIPLAESFRAVFASDVHDWGYGDRRDLDFTFALGADAPWPVDWIITNPPFVLAEAFLDRALSIARLGVAMLLRTQWLEGGDRWRSVYGAGRAPRLICPFADRVPMIEAAWDPEASSATSYSWFVWAGAVEHSTVVHIRPGAERRYLRLQDRSLAMPGEAARRRKARQP
jgi:hypothetical protein